MATVPNSHHPASPAASAEIPRGDLVGFKKHFKQDIVAGFLVFLIALPLCLGIALASGFPPIAGVFTAIVGSVLTSLLSNSELTIKGPAAGLIVIVLGAVQSFGHTGGQDPVADIQAYKMALAVGCVAGVLQIVFGMLRAGVLGDFFPTSAVHGMLAAIGIIIMLKQLPVAVGQKAAGEPIEILRELPTTLLNLNPEIAVIGGVSLAILFGFPWIKSRFRAKWLQIVPSQMVVLLVAVPMGMWFDLSHEHTYSFAGHTYELGERFLVTVPGNMFKAMAFPDFSVFTNPELRVAAIKWVLMFALIGSLESMLSAKAIDLLDPWKRKTALNRDMIAVGIANIVTSMVGGLPMISEIVRSKANIDNGARTRFSDFWHGIFLLGFVALVPGLIHRIPLAALAAMLVYTGFRLASPREFVNVYKIGREQLAIFVVTIVGVLATDLLIGIAIGITLKFIIHMVNGVPFGSIFKPFLAVQTIDENTVQIDARGSAVFTNWIPFRRQIEQLGLVQRHNVIVNLAGTTLVDHSVMEKLHEMEIDFEQAGLRLEIIGLDTHRQLSRHPHAARKRGMVRIKRVTIVTDAALESSLAAKIIEFGASGYTAIPCRGVGRSKISQSPVPLVRIEVVAPTAVAERLLNYLHAEVAPTAPVTVCSEVVEVLKVDQF